MHRSKAAVAAALLTALALLPLAVAPVAAGDSKDKAKAEHERIVKYWTAERIAERQAARLRPDGPTASSSRRPGHRNRPARRRRGQGCLLDRRRPRRPAHRQGPVHDGRRQLGLLGVGHRRLPLEPLPGPDRRALRLRRGQSSVRDELDVRPLVRYRADVHLRPVDVRLLDRRWPRRPQRLRVRGRLQHPGHGPRLRVRDRRGGRQDATPSSMPSARTASPTRRSRPAGACIRSATRPPASTRART